MYKRQYVDYTRVLCVLFTSIKSFFLLVDAQVTQPVVVWNERAGDAACCALSADIVFDQHAAHHQQTDSRPPEWNTQKAG